MKSFDKRKMQQCFSKAAIPNILRLTMNEVWRCTTQLLNMCIVRLKIVSLACNHNKSVYIFKVKVNTESEYHSKNYVQIREALTS